MIESTCFESRAVIPVHILNVYTRLLQARHSGLGTSLGLICGVIQNLDLQSVTWIVEASHSADQALDDVILVVDR